MHITFIEQLKREAVFILVFTVSVFMSAVLFRYLLLPEVISYTTNTSTMVNFQDLISSEHGYQKIKEEIINKNQKLHSRLSNYSSTGADPKELSSILELLIGKAKASDIRFVKMQPQEETRTQDYRLFPVILDFTTTYHSLGQFLASLESLPYMFKVNRLAMDSSDANDIDVKVLITCLIPLQDNL